MKRVILASVLSGLMSHGGDSTEVESRADVAVEDGEVWRPTDYRVGAVTDEQRVRLEGILEGMNE